MSSRKSNTKKSQGNIREMGSKAEKTTSRGRDADDIPTGQRSKKSHVPGRSKNSPTTRTGPVEGMNPPLRNNVQCVDSRTYSNDPMQVQQWVASSGISPQPVANDVIPMLSGSNDHDNVYPGFPNSGYPPAMHSSLSHESVHFHPGMSNFSVPMANFLDGSAGDDVAAFNTACVPLDQDLLDPGVSLGDQYGKNGWSVPEDASYDAPSAAEMAYSTSSTHRQGHSVDFEDAQGLPICWTELPPPGLDYVHIGAVPCTQDMIWSSITPGALEPSISSSYSQNSYVPMQAGSPRSPKSQDDVRFVEYPGIVDEEYGFSHHGIDCSPLQPVPLSCLHDGQVDMASTLRASQGSQRAALSNVNYWPQMDPLGDAPLMPTHPDGFARRMSNEGESTSARRDDLYHVGPREDDGLYHCPFEAEDGCSHKPDKLKCNYDKHLDSHLKPYRCKVLSCSAVPFSSTACLLRHEREAHGMHGHGEKPYLCTYPSCDRSVAGQGFPRRWNLQDHMRRVHDHAGQPSSGSTSPTPSSVSSQCQGKTTLAIRKRRTSNNPQSQPMKKTRSASGTKTATKAIKPVFVSNPQEDKRQTMQKLWLEEHAALKERLDYLTPTDALGLEQVGAHYNIMHSIGLNLRRLEAGDLAITE